jgi:osmotically-inducible protein OsmY
MRTSDMVAGRMRDAQRKIDRAKRYGGAEVEGLQQRMQHAIRGDRPPVDDVELAHKVESKLFGDPNVPKGRINVDVAEGRVTLRGKLDNEAQIRSIERTARRISGVVSVQNLLHTDGPAPNVREALRASSRATNEIGRIGRSS